MNKSLMLMAVVLIFANGAIAQEDKVKKIEKAQMTAEELQHCKALKLKERMQAKEYHYHDGWVQHLEAH